MSFAFLSAATPPAPDIELRKSRRLFRDSKGPAPSR